MVSQDKYTLIMTRGTHTVSAAEAARILDAIENEEKTVEADVEFVGIDRQTSAARRSSSRMSSASSRRAKRDRRTRSSSATLRRWNRCATLGLR